MSDPVFDNPRDGLRYHLEQIVEHADEAISASERCEHGHPAYIDVEKTRVERHKAIKALEALDRGEMVKF